MRVKAFTVILDDDYKDESFEAIQQSIRMIRGVLEVKAHEVEPLTDVIAEERALAKLRQDFHSILFPRHV